MSGSDEQMHNSVQQVQKLLEWIRSKHGNELPAEVSQILNGSTQEHFNYLQSEDIAPDYSQEVGFHDNDVPDEGLNHGICAYCAQVFQSTVELSKHALIHFRLIINRLPDNPPRDTQVKKPRLRVKIYEHGNMFHCGVCEDKFTSRGKGLTHWKRTHAELSDLVTFKCLVCDKVLSSRASLRQHSNDVHSVTQASHLCSFCGQKFRLEKYLKKHVSYVHIRKKSFKCSYCSASFVTSDALKVHENRHLGRNKKQCPYCGVLQAPNSIKKHIEFVHEGKRLKCNLCAERLSSTASVRPHFLLKHLDQVDFESVRDVTTPVQIDVKARTKIILTTNLPSDGRIECDQNLRNNEDSNTRVVEEIQEFVESQDEELLTIDRREIDTEFQTVSLEIPKKQCPTCAKYFTHLEAHCLSAHSTSDTVYKCKFCEQEFKCYSSLHSHVRWTHLLKSGKLKVKATKRQKLTTRSLKLACIMCNVVFDKRSHYEVHMRKHGKDPEYRLSSRKRVKRVGETTGSGSTSKSVHLPVVPEQSELTENATLACPYKLCGLILQNIRNLRQHLRTSHPDFTGYASRISTRTEGQEAEPSSTKSKCHVCGKFIFWCNLKRHINQVHGGARPYPCLICSKSFHQKSSLELHETTVRHLQMVEQQQQREQLESSVILIINAI